MLISFQIMSGIGKGLNKPAGLFDSYLFCWQTSQAATKLMIVFVKPGNTNVMPYNDMYRKPRSAYRKVWREIQQKILESKENPWAVPPFPYKTRSLALAHNVLAPLDPPLEQ